MHDIDNNSYAFGMWPVVVFNVLLVLWFALSLLHRQGDVEWRTMGVFIGFFVVPFTEMYGLPRRLLIDQARSESARRRREDSWSPEASRNVANRGRTDSSKAFPV